MHLYVDKNTDQMRSTFIAVGLAELLRLIPPRQSGQQVVLYDQGSCYFIESRIDAERLTQFVAANGILRPVLPAISKPLTAKERRLLDAGQKSEAELLSKYLPPGFEAAGGQHIAYGDHKQIFDAYRKYCQNKNAPREEEGPQKPHPDFPVWAHLNSYFGKGSAMRVGYPGLIHAWHAHQGEAALELWELILYCYGSFPNAVMQTHRTWEEQIMPQLEQAGRKIEALTSALAVVSPSTSKGVSAPSGFNRLTENTPTEFWLEMYFAFAGFMSVAMPYNIGGDVITYYPVPADIEMEELRDVVQRHRESTAARSLYVRSNNLPRGKLDVLNQIVFYKNMVAHFIERTNDGSLPEDTPMNTISGLYGYYYKDISTQIPFDETFFALPAWLPGKVNLETLERAEATLEEHYRLVESLGDKRGKSPKYQITADELVIIDAYRRYITHGEAEDWIQFAIRFGMYHFRHMTEMRLPSMSLQLFKESLPMVSNDRRDYRPILENPGFQKIAGAINYCTCYSRYKKDVQKDRTFPFKVRHGLGDDLMRNAHNPELFLSDLSEFIHDYRRESINVQANTEKTRPEIEPEDIHHIAGLIAEHGSRIVAYLLVATGYAARFGSDN